MKGPPVSWAVVGGFGAIVWAYEGWVVALWVSALLVSVSWWLYELRQLVWSLRAARRNHTDANS